MKRSQSKILKVENAPFSETSQTKKVMHFRPTAGGLSYGVETALAEANREISQLFSKYSEVLREKASEDASLLSELEDILNEARSLEADLKERKETLRQSLAMISDKLKIG